MAYIVFDYGDDPFLGWMNANPSGYVLNTSKGPASADHMLHRAGCSHLSGLVGDQGPDGYTMKDYIKVCSLNPQELMQWYVQHRPINSGIENLCKECFKDQTIIEDIWLELLPFAQEGTSFMPPGRVTQTVSVPLRNIRIADSLKLLYHFTCQICGVTISMPGDKTYIEVHHIQPLGSPFYGIDHPSNMICVCPNHHVQLDYAAIYLHMKDLTVHPNHKINQEFLDHHNQLVEANYAG